MKWLKRAAALTLLVLWGPVTMHCALETVPGFSFLQWCCGSEKAPQSDDDCTQDSCNVLESGFYKIEDNPVVAPGLALLTSFSPWTPVSEPLANSSPGLTSASLAPPELPRIWQFASRTALPPRAPSPAF